MIKTKPSKIYDPELAKAIKNEIVRQEEHIELIASENYASPRVIEAQGSVLTNKYAEGYPNKRYYGGCEFVDQTEGTCDRSAQEDFWSRACQRTASFRISSKCCRVSGTLFAR